MAFSFISTPVAPKVLFLVHISYLTLGTYIPCAFIYMANRHFRLNTSNLELFTPHTKPVPPLISFISINENTICPIAYIKSLSVTIETSIWSYFSTLYCTFPPLSFP